MDGLWVSELARRSGVPATTLRFYEQQGLLPAARTASGYRVYDDVAVDRLGFIVAGKRLGLTLPEIRQLLAPWEHGVCRDVQTELVPLLGARISDARAQIAQLQAFTHSLEAALEHLARIDRDGPCDRSCTFLQDPTRLLDPAQASSPLPRWRVDVLAQSAPAVGTQPPATACSLGLPQRADRVRRWRAALQGVTARRRIESGWQLDLDPERVEFGEVAQLAAAETGCCAFLDLRLRFGPRPMLEVRAPADALAVVTELFGDPAA